MKESINTWKYNLQYSDEMSVCPGGHIMMNGICRHAVSINVQLNTIECTTLQIIK
jgi:hypothetical protein